MDNPTRVTAANREHEIRQLLLSPSSGSGTRRRRRSSASNSPEFEFWMVRNPSFPQPNLLSADELFVDGVLLPLHLLHSSNHHHQQQPDPPDPLPAGPTISLGEPDEPKLMSPTSITAAEATSTTVSSLTSSKRWTDIFKKSEKKTGSDKGGGGKKNNQQDKLDREKETMKKERDQKKREKKSHSRGSSSAELNINIWPFSRSRSAGNSCSRPRLFPGAPGITSRKASSAPCSRSNSGGESKSRKWPSSPGRAGVHLGRSSPVWQVRRGGGSGSANAIRSTPNSFYHHDSHPLAAGVRQGEKGASKNEVTEPRRSKSSSSGGSGSNNDGDGGGSKVKAKVLNVNMAPMCIGYRNQLSCGSEENSTIGVGGRSNRGGGGVENSNINYLGNGNGNGSGSGSGHSFNLRTLFTKKKGQLMV